MQTEGLWYLGERQIEMRPMEIPDPGPEDVLVALEACGICNWDIQSYAGKFGRHQTYPFCAGHEGVGRVIAAGSRVSTVAKGQRVTLHELPVGPPGNALMARHAMRRQDQLAVIPDEETAVGPDAAQWIVEPVCCVVNGIHQAGIQPGDRVAVVGAGYMGLLFVQGLGRSLTSRITVFDLDPARLALAGEMGADEGFDPLKPLPEELAGSYDVIIETAGVPESLELSMGLAKTGAIIETFAWHHHDHAFDLEVWHLKGLRLLNIQPGMTPHFGDLYPRTVALMANGTFTNRLLVTHTGLVEKAATIFDAALDRTGGYIKGVIEFKQ